MKFIKLITEKNSTIKKCISKFKNGFIFTFGAQQNSLLSQQNFKEQENRTIDTNCKLKLYNNNVDVFTQAKKTLDNLNTINTIEYKSIEECDSYSYNYINSVLNNKRIEESDYSFDNEIYNINDITIGSINSENLDEDSDNDY